MDRELLIAGDRTTLDVLERVQSTAANPPSLGNAIHAARVATAQGDEERLERALLDVAAASIHTVTRIRRTR
jgi:hypothetical protein